MLERNRKHRCLPPCLARQARTVSMCWLVVNPMGSNHNLRAFWKPVNPPDCVWENLYQINVRTIVQEKETMHCNITIFVARGKGSSGQGMGKLEKIPAWNLTKVRSKKELIEEARNKCKTVHFASLMDICHLKNAELETTHQKIQRSSCVPRQHCERRFRLFCSIYRARIISFSNDSSKSHGYHLQIARLRWTSSGRSICLYPSENGRCAKIIENSKIGMSRHLDSSTMTQMA